jgi:hypothetical protein
MDKQTRPLNYNLAALLFYDEKGITKQFEELPAEEQETWLFRATKILGLLDKLNLTVTKKQDPEEVRAKNEKAVETLTQLIKGFVKGLNNTKPALFPAEELARRILK